VGVAIGIPLAFAIAGAVPTVLAVTAIILAMPRDEIEHPLDPEPREVEAPSQQVQ
jgi:hypothetical protein